MSDWPDIRDLQERRDALAHEAALFFAIAKDIYAGRNKDAPPGRFDFCIGETEKRMDEIAAIELKRAALAPASVTVN